MASAGVGSSGVQRRRGEHLAAMAAELGQRRQAQKRARREIARDKAFWDCVALGSTARRPPQGQVRPGGGRVGPQAAPCRSLDIINRWYQEDGWEERALAGDCKAIPSSATAFAAARALRQIEVSALLRLGLTVFKQILEGADKTATAATKLRAAEFIAHLAGLGSLKQPDPEQKAPPIISPNGGVVNIDQLYNRLLGKR